MIQYTKWLFERFWYGDEYGAAGPPSEPVAPPPPARSTLIGDTVATLIRARNVQISEEQRLTDEIAALVETRRQRRKQIEAMTAAIATIGDDPALTEVERNDVAANRDIYINTPDIGM